MSRRWFSASLTARDELDPDPERLIQSKNRTICRYTARNILTLRVTLSVSLVVSLTPPSSSPKRPFVRPHEAFVLFWGFAGPTGER